MGKQFKDHLKGTLIVPIGLSFILAPYSLLIGWNLITVFLFWLVLIPALTIYLPTKISKNKDHLLESLAGLLIFYGFMVFMIYDHYKTDYFQVMMASCVVNLILVATIILVKRSKLYIQ